MERQSKEEGYRLQVVCRGFSYIQISTCITLIRFYAAGPDCDAQSVMELQTYMLNPRRRAVYMLRHSLCFISITERYGETLLTGFQTRLGPVFFLLEINVGWHVRCGALPKEK